MSDDTEWRVAVAELTEMDRATACHEPRHSLGVCGDKGDAHYE